MANGVGSPGNRKRENQRIPGVALDRTTRHRIDPTVDCVFKALLGSKRNKNLLVHFLNAVMDPPTGRRVKKVTIQNPHNEREFLSDKLSIVNA